MANSNYKDKDQSVKTIPLGQLHVPVDGLLVITGAQIIKKGPSSSRGTRSGSFHTESQRRDNDASKRKR